MIRITKIKKTIIEIFDDNGGQVEPNHKPPHKRRATHIIFINEKGQTTTMETITIGNPPRNITAKPVDDTGTPQPVDTTNPIAWSVTPSGLVTIAPASDGLSCQITGIAEGQVAINTTVDADPGQGVTMINGSLQANVVAPQPPPVMATFISMAMDPEAPPQK